MFADDLNPGKHSLSGGREFHPPYLPEPDGNLSIHPAPIIPVALRRVSDRPVGERAWVRSRDATPGRAGAVPESFVFLLCPSDHPVHPRMLTAFTAQNAFHFVSSVTSMGVDVTGRLSCERDVCLKPIIFLNLSRCHRCHGFCLGCG